MGIHIFHSFSVLKVEDEFMYFKCKKLILYHLPPICKISRLENKAFVASASSHMYDPHIYMSKLQFTLCKSPEV